MSAAPTGLTEVKAYLIQNLVEDNLMWKGQDLLSGWTESMIAERRVSVLKEKDWTNAAPIYRQINVLRDISLFLKAKQ